MLSLGLQHHNQRAIWASPLRIAAGHAVSATLVAETVLTGLQFIFSSGLQLWTAI